MLKIFRLILVATIAVYCILASSHGYAQISQNTMLSQESNNVKEFHLDNGLKILIKEDHSAPVFAQALFYRVGSRNDLEKTTGSAHFLEHMQFNGTEKRQKGDIAQQIEFKGGTFNAGTSFDYTVYYMTLPSDSGNLDFALELEADRMKNSIINEEEAKREKQVVLQEMSRGENSPISLLIRESLKNIYPEHPYGDPIIGWREDVENTTAEDLKQQYKAFYQPNNATLVLVGDIQTHRTLQLIKKYFSQITPSEESINQEASKRHIRPHTAQRIKVQTPTKTQATFFAWRAVPFTHKDYIALSVLSSILADGSLSRLEKSLIDTGLASAISSSMRQGIDPGIFSILSTTSEGENLNKIQKVIESEIDKIQKYGINQNELDRVKAKAQTSFLSGIEEPSELAMQLGYFDIVGRNWRRTFTWVNEIDSITKEQIQEVATKYLTKDSLFLSNLVDGEANFDGSDGKPHVEKEHSLSTQKGIQSKEYILDNGLRVILQENSSNQLIALHGAVDAGEVIEKIGSYSYGASYFTANMLERGTTDYTRDQIANQLETIGASVDITSDLDFVSIDGEVINRHIEPLVKILGQQLQQPNFKEEELSQLKQQLILQLEQSKDNSSNIASIKLKQAIYPTNHPYYDLSIEDQITEIRKLSVSDLQKFHKDFYTPNTTTLVFSGNFESDELISLLKKYFSDWKPSNTQQVQYHVPVVPTVDNPSDIIDTVKGKSQSIIILGHAGEITRDHPDYYALVLANDVLGGGSSLTSRLGYNVREKEGLVYSVYSYMRAYRGAGSFKIIMGTAPDKVEQAIAISRKTITEFLNEGISDEELERAKNYRKGSFISHNLVTNSSIAGALNLYAILGLDLNLINEYPNKIQSISKDEVMRVAKKYLHPDSLQVVIINPE